LRSARLRRLLWFVALWAAGVLALSGIAYLLRLVMGVVYGPAA